MKNKITGLIYLSLSLDVCQIKVNSEKFGCQSQISTYVLFASVPSIESDMIEYSG